MTRALFDVVFVIAMAGLLALAAGLVGRWRR